MGPQAWPGRLRKRLVARNLQNLTRFLIGAPANRFTLRSVKEPAQFVACGKWPAAWPALVVCILTALAGVLAAGEARVQPRHSGPGTPFDLQGCVDRQIAAGSNVVVVPPGRYRVSPRDRQHLVLRNLKDIRILAEGVEMVCTETTRALTISRCTNVTVRGLVIDYDPLPYTQGRITAISEDSQVYDIELFDGYPEASKARNFKYEVFRPDTRTLRCEDRGVTKLEVVDARHLRVTSPGRERREPEQVGDLIVIGAEDAPHGSAGHAVECSSNSNVRVENVVLFASNCFGFLEHNCDGSVYSGCAIDRRSPKDDFVQRGSPRLRSLDADAYHSKHAVRGPAYLNCTARFMGDDCVNICGDYHMIMGSKGRELRVLAKHDLNIRPGDPVELVCYDGRRLADARVVAVQPEGRVRDEERAFIARQHMDAGLKSGRGALTQAYTVTLDREEPIAMGGVICSANRVGNGFSVKGCVFGYNRSRGILIKASRGEVSGNRIEGARMSAVLVAPEYWWLEAGSSSDLKITDNTIQSCQGIPIAIEAAAWDGGIAPAGAHQNIVITGNIIRDCPAPGIVVCSTSGLVLENNTLQLNETRKSVPGVMRQAGLKALQPVVEIHCTHKSQGRLRIDPIPFKDDGSAKAFAPSTGPAAVK